jgi:hypothetical protein
MSRSSIEDGPTMNMVMTHGGYELDMNNIPGKLRAKLIKRGDLNADSIGLPPNMPGAKLKALREELKARARKEIKQAGFQVGELIKYGEHTYEIIDVDDEHVYIHRPHSTKPDTMARVKIKIDKVIRVLVDGE